MRVIYWKCDRCDKELNSQPDNVKVQEKMKDGSIVTASLAWYIDKGGHDICPDCLFDIINKADKRPKCQPN